MNSTPDPSAAMPPTSPSFRLKGGLFPLTLLEVTRYNSVEFADDLRCKVAEAPAFFQQTPVIISLEQYTENVELLPLSELQQLCREYGLIPVAVRSGSESLQQQALALGMALMPEGRSRSETPNNAVVETVVETESVDEIIAEPIAGNSSKIITTPIRSGQQVYAAGGDLIVMAAVSAGAEVLADGNIHIYGALRGRALAGVRGDTSARIFCQSLEAELISIAGNFKLDEDFKREHWKKPVQASLSEQTLSITALL